MKVKELRLRNFRNLSFTTLNPHPRLNFIYGDNGQGKTSLLEAIYFISTLRSFRCSKNIEPIAWGNQKALVECDIASPTKDVWITQLKLSLEIENINTGKISKLATINGKPYKSSTQYLSQKFGNFELGFHTIVFNPSDHDLIHGEPQIRRQYIDRVISSEDPTYLNILQKFRRCLEQRNLLLKERLPIFGYHEVYSSLSAHITFRRLQWFSRFNDRIRLNLQKIFPDHLPSCIILKSVMNHQNDYQEDQVHSLEAILKQYQKKLIEVEEREKAAGFSFLGPHREDWSFFINKKNIKTFGSQGEIRTVLLGLKITEIEMFRDSTRFTPVFLLDDFSSELDQNRRSYLLSFLTETDLQVFVTTTDSSPLFGSRFYAKSGTLVAT